MPTLVPALCGLAGLLLAGSFTPEAQAQVFLKTGRIWAIGMGSGHPNAAGDVTSGWYPADYNVVSNQGFATPATGSSLDLFVRNLKHPETGEIVEKAIVGPVSELNPDGTVVEEIQSYVRYLQPEITVNGEEVTQAQYGQKAPEQLVGNSDQTIESTFEYVIGVEAHRKAFVFSNEAHDDYIVVDIVFTNKSDQTFEDFAIGFDLPMYGTAWGSNPPPGGLSSSNNRWYHYYGATPADTQRVFYAYHADDPTAAGDQIANPAMGQQGRLITKDAQFVAFLHISEEPYTDPSGDVNDPIQPRTTYAAKSGLIGIGVNARAKQPISQSSVRFDAMYGFIADRNGRIPGSYPGTNHEVNNDTFGHPDYTAFSSFLSIAPPHGPSVGIGPYTFAPGEQIHLVYAYGAAGLGIEGAVEIGKKYFNGTLEPPPGLPDPQTGFFPENFRFPAGATQNDINKDLWYSTVIDSVHETVYRARWNFEHDWMVPKTPPPPDSLTIKGFPDEARISWHASGAEDDPRFAGYRVMRRKSTLDTAQFHMVHRVPPEAAADRYVFNDSAVQFGASYYYYVQTGFRIPEDDLSALPENRGTVVWSGRTLIPTPLSIEPPRGGTEDLDDILVAPNPYNLNDPAVRAQGWDDDRGIVFFNLPAQVDVDIYTEDGDHVVHIIHDSPVRAGSIHWDMLTKSNQVIESGVYIAVFTRPDGAVAYRKFVVAR